MKIVLERGKLMVKKVKETIVVFFSFVAGVFHYIILSTFGQTDWRTILMTIASFMIIMGGVSMIGNEEIPDNWISDK